MVFILNFPLHFWNGFHTHRAADRAKNRVHADASPDSGDNEASGESSTPSEGLPASPSAPFCVMQERF